MNPSDKQKQELEQETEELSLLRQEAELFRVTDDEGYQLAAGAVVELKAKAKALDTRRKEITRPIDAAKKSVMDLFRTPLNEIEKARKAFEKSMTTWDREQAEARQKLLQAAAQEKKPAKARELVKAATVTDLESPDGLTVVKSWDFEIEYPQQVPRQLCAPVPALIRQIVQREGDKANIPGVRVFEKTTYRKK